MNKLLKIVPVALVAIMLTSCGKAEQPETEELLQKVFPALFESQKDKKRFYALPEEAKKSFVDGRDAEAKQQAEGLLTLAERFSKDWNYGNAIHDGNMVLGRLAVKSSQLALAKSYLAKAGSTLGSPQLNSFGPNMSLALDLLKKGESAEVLEYFQMCAKFWKLHRGDLDKWSEEVKAGRYPNFGANLRY